MKKNKKWLKIFVPILSVIMFIATIFVINILSLSNPTKGDAGDAIVEYTEPK